MKRPLQGREVPAALVEQQAGLNLELSKRPADLTYDRSLALPGVSMLAPPKSFLEHLSPSTPGGMLNLLNPPRIGILNLMAMERALPNRLVPGPNAQSSEFGVRNFGPSKPREEEIILP
jgi:hypothetical protein